MNATYSSERMRRGLLHFVGGRAAQALARGLLLLLLVRLLPLADYGAYMLIVGLSESMLRLASFGIVPVGQRFMPQVVTSSSAATLKQFCFGLVSLQWLILFLAVAMLSVFWLQVSPLFGFSNTQALATQAGLALLLLVPAFRFAAELLETMLEQGRAQGLRALMPTLRLLTILLLLGFGIKLQLAEILLIDIVVTGLVLLGAYVQLTRSLSDHGGQGKEALPLAEITRHARHMAIVDLLGAFNSPGAIRAVLASSLGLNASGLFAFLQSMERLVSRYLPGTLLRGLIRPLMIDRYQKEDGAGWVSSGMNLLIKFNLLIVSAAAIAVLAAGDEMVQLLSGDKFMNAGNTLLVMALALIVSSQQSIMEMVMQVTRQTEILRSTAFLTPIALLLIALGLAPGLEAAVILLAIATGVAIALQMRVLTQNSNVSLLGAAEFTRIAAPALMSATCIFITLNFVGSYLSAACALIVFAAMLLLAKPLSVSETALLDRGFGKKLGKLLRPITHKSTQS